MSSIQLDLLQKVVELDCTISDDFGKILLQPFDVDHHNSPFKSMFHCGRVGSRHAYLTGHMTLMSSCSVLSLHKDHLEY